MARKPAQIIDKNLKEKLKNEYLGGNTIKSLAWKYDIKETTLGNLARAEGWSVEKKEIRSEAKNMRRASRDALQEDALDRAFSILHKVIVDTEDSVYGNDTEQIKINIKTMSDVLDKLTRLAYFVKTGGVEKKQVNINKTNHKIDWNKIIEQSIKAKKEHGKDFNEKTFLKQAIDIEVKNNEG